MESPLRTPRIVLGLLGAIGAGKSHVAARIRDLTGAAVVDADRLAADALADCARDGRLESRLGAGVVGPDGGPARDVIASRVFEDDAALDALEALIHPPVLAGIRRAVQEHRAGRGPDLLVLDVPLLLEKDLEELCDALWFVEVNDDVRQRRARDRGMDAAELARRARRQMAVDAKRARADRVIRNDGDDLDASLLAALRSVEVEVHEPS